MSSNPSTEGTHRGRFSPLRLVLLALGLVVLVAVVWFGIESHLKSNTKPPAPSAVHVNVASARKINAPVYLNGIGTVQAFYTVTVTARVDGQLDKVNFVEGQDVVKGALLAQIDPRPNQAALDLAIASKAKDQAQLVNARQDLERYNLLAPEDLASKQTVDTQRALVAQLEAQIKGDQATIDNARTQLDYTTITSPISGRTGIRLVDPGNNVHASDTTGIVVVTQVKPISVIFTLPEDNLPAINKALGAGRLEVTAFSRDGKTALDKGVLLLVDNLIDQTTGTIRVKATFPNHGETLWPGAFVNARVLLKTLPDALSVPSTAIKRGPNGLFTYVVGADSKVQVRPLSVSGESDGTSIVSSGLTEGERVVVNNQYRLQPGALIAVDPDQPAAPAAAPGSGSDKTS